MIKNNKRGQAQYFLESAFRIGFLMIALLAFFLLINFYVINRIDTNKLQAEVVADRLIYSNIIMYEENSRIYAGIVDMTKFDDDIISNNIVYEIKRHAAAKLELIDNVDGIVNDTAYLNKLQYDNLYTLAKSAGRGKGGATIYTKYYPVTYKNGDKYLYGTIRMNIIIPNS
jgi:hypothetical protein